MLRTDVAATAAAVLALGLAACGGGGGGSASGCAEGNAGPAGKVCHHGVYVTPKTQVTPDPTADSTPVLPSKPSPAPAPAPKPSTAPSTSASSCGPPPGIDPQRAEGIRAECDTAKRFCTGTPAGIAGELGLPASADIGEIADKYSEDFQPSFRVFAVEGCLDGLAGAGGP